MRKRHHVGKGRSHFEVDPMKLAHLIEPGKPVTREALEEVAGGLRRLGSSSAQLRRRIAKALGWSEAEVGSFPLITIREQVRHVNPSLADEISERIRSGRVVLE